jgi:hypothetical protein
MPFNSSKRNTTYKPGYKHFIEENLSIVDKNGVLVPFKLNEIQNSYLKRATNRDIILKARQQGFSSLILALFTVDFILKPNARNVIVADISDNAMELLDRVKLYLETYEESTGIPVKLKYNSKYELYNEIMKSRYTIGTADKADFGRSKTITNLHFSEFAFYRDPESLLGGAMQAVVPDGRVVIETTANGFNYFKDYWSKTDETGFNPLFFKASDFYDEEFLQQKRNELGRLYQQEYPDTPMEAFVTSGDSYFDKESLSQYLKETENVEEI